MNKDLTKEWQELSEKMTRSLEDRVATLTCEVYRLTNDLKEVHLHVQRLEQDNIGRRLPEPVKTLAESELERQVEQMQAHIDKLNIDYLAMLEVAEAVACIPDEGVPVADIMLRVYELRKHTRAIL